MNYQTQNALTVLASSIFFGSAGFWLIPSQLKGAVVGAASGTVGAVGYAQQSRRLRQIAAQQNQVSFHNTYQERVEGLETLVDQAEKAIADIDLSVTEHKAEINSIQDTVQTSLDKSKVSLAEVKQLEARLIRLESKTTFGVNKQSDSNLSSGFKAEFTAENQDEASGDEAKADEAQKVIEWFESNHIEVDNYYEPDYRIDNMLDGLSLYLGDNYSILSNFHWKLRNSVGRKLHFNLKEYDSRSKRIHNQYLRKLKSSDYLSDGKLVKKQESPDFIIAAPYNRSDIQGFFDGGWFERFIYYKVVELLDAEGADYQYLRNPKISYNNNETSELDLFFLVNQKPLLIECKAGVNYHQGIEKFVKHRERLNLDSSNAIFVVLDIDEAEAYIRTHNWKITVADQNNFLSQIKQLLNENISEPSETADEELEEETEPAADDSSLKSFFKKWKLNRAPEYRTAILNELIQLVDSLDEPVSFNEITKIIRDRMKSSDASLARIKISEILNCLRRFDLFRSENNKPVRNTATPIFKMASLKVKTLEKKCMEFYAEKTPSKGIAI
ncbi:hypothetical protein [Sphaerothrix gracilis]|uniref:hypothetical protein n=1 Tax=Sphaerothrix gracilis TaxID=3151835 RepID=UPI0031FD38F1